MTSGTKDVCSPCYWGECLEKPGSCMEQVCVCRCKPRRPVSDSTNEYVRRALARELRGVAYQGGVPAFSAEKLAGLLKAADLIEQGEI
jgi:hypothetical protein